MAALLRTGVLDQVASVAGGGSLKPEVLAERLMLAIYGYGTNTGIRAVIRRRWLRHNTRYTVRARIRLVNGRHVTRSRSFRNC